MSSSPMLRTLAAILVLVSLFQASLAQLAPCESSEQCTREGETCNMVGNGGIVTCEGNPVNCFCSPADPLLFKQCTTVADCTEPNQKCGRPSQLLQVSICVGCDSIPVEVTESNLGSCTRPSESPTPSILSIPSITLAPTLIPPTPSVSPHDLDPQVSTVPREPEPSTDVDGTFSPMSPGVTVTPSVSFVNDPNPSATVDTNFDPDDDDDEEQETDDPNNEDITENNPDTDTNLPPSASPDVQASPTDETDDDDGICIDAELLMKSLKMNELVFDTHRRASVLCDEFDSCATPGHMVHYQGLGMMMKSYCSLNGIKCSQKVKFVNSPKYQVSLKIKSKTSDLSFTTYAARYGTKVEEHVLKTLIHVGL